MKAAPYVCVLSFALSVGAQDVTIRTTVPLVVLPTSVTDRNGHPIYGLSASDFVLLDEGKPRPARVDDSESGVAPVALVIAVQTSDISASALGKIRKVGAVISEAVVGGNAEAAVLTFDNKVTVVRDFTSQPDTISDAFDGLKPADNDGGRMIDAVAEALEMLANRKSARRANVLIIGETRDRGSETKLSDLLSKTQHSGVTIYSLGYSAFLTPFTTKASEYTPPDGGGLLKAITETARLSKPNTVEALTSATGGRRMKFETKSKLENDLIGVGTEIHNRYVLSFTPERDNSPGFHRIEVKVKNRPDAVVRVRPGYWSGLSEAAN